MHKYDPTVHVHLGALKLIPKITTMTSDSGVKIRSGGGWREVMEEGSLETCSVGLQQQRKLIRADKGEIRR